MAVNLSPVGGVAGQFFDNNGDPLVGGKLFTYAAGTTTPQTTFTTSTGVTPNSNPIILNAGGRVPSEIWLTDGLQYKFVLYSSTDQLIGSWDNIIGINSNFVNFTTAEEVQIATAGQTVFTLTTMQYAPGTNNLVVYVDGVNQVEGGAYSFVETDSTTVTFTAALHLGAVVKFVSAEILSTGVVDASNVVYTPAGTGAVATNVQAKLRETVSVKDFGAVGDGVTDDTAAIQAAIDYAGSKNGAVVELSWGEYKITSTLIIDKSAVVLVGQGSDIEHSPSVTSSGSATKIIWGGSAGGTMLSFLTPLGASNSKCGNQGLKDLEIDGNGVAGTGINIKSVNALQLEQLLIVNLTDYGIYADCYNSGEIGDVPDNQAMNWRNLIVWFRDGINTTNAVGVFLSGSPTPPGGNTSGNYFELCRFRANGKSALILDNADNNVFVRCAFATENTGEFAVQIRGTISSSGSNHFYNLNASPAFNGVRILGTASGYPHNPQRNSFLMADNLNGFQPPNADPGCQFTLVLDNGYGFFEGFVRTAIGDTLATTIQAKNDAADTALAIRASTGRHIRLLAATGSWEIQVDNVTGALNLVRRTGTGALRLPAADGSSISIFGSGGVSLGAPDSGGTGFRVLRVPN